MSARRTRTASQDHGLADVGLFVVHGQLCHAIPRDERSNVSASFSICPRIRPTDLVFEVGEGVLELVAPFLLGVDVGKPALEVVLRKVRQTVRGAAAGESIPKTRGSLARFARGGGAWWASGVPIILVLFVIVIVVL